MNSIELIDLRNSLMTTFTDARRSRSVKLDFRPSSYSCIVETYLNEHFASNFKCNKNLQYHYKNVLSNGKYPDGEIREESSIFKDDSILMVSKRRNYKNTIISNIDYRGLLTTDEWLNSNRQVELKNDGKLYGYRVMMFMSRSTSMMDSVFKFDNKSPFFEDLTNEFRKVLEYYLDEIFYQESYEFSKLKDTEDFIFMLNYIKNNKRELSELNQIINIYMESMDDKFLTDIIKLKNDIILIDDLDLVENEILSSDIYKEKLDLYKKSLRLNKILKSKDLETGFLLESFGYTDNLDKSINKKRLKSIIKSIIGRNKYCLNKIVGLIN